MKNKVNISKVQKHETAQSGMVDVVKGKLIFIPTKEGSDLTGSFMINPFMIPYKPVIVSETEPIDDEDKILSGDTICTVSKNRGSYLSVYELSHLDLRTDKCMKILAMPENFLPEHLQAIVEEKMKSGDDVLVECKELLARYSDGNLLYGTGNYQIKFSEDNITLHKDDDLRMYTRKQLEYEISYAVAYMMAHPKTTAAEMQINQDKLNEWMKEYVK